MNLSTSLTFLYLIVGITAHNLKGGKWKKNQLEGLCIVGCTPYVNPDDLSKGILKWKQLVDDMAESCEIMVHVGDTKAGAAVCNKDLMVSTTAISSFLIPL